WLANLPQNIHYWSHAGHYFSLEGLGNWWVATNPAEWPRNREELDKILADFERVPENLGSGRFGDRRQEIVFIGIDMDQEAIEALMDGCLLTDDEMKIYIQR
ncbi:hypothetical protein GUITHDRAFT_59931, partial [Guillardia theta CCMP2712]